MAQGQKINEEEWAQIKEFLDKKIKPKQIALKINRSSNTVYSEIRRRGISISGRASKSKQEVTWELSDEPDYSKLPDDVLFNPKMFPAF